MNYDQELKYYPSEFCGVNFSNGGNVVDLVCNGEEIIRLFRDESVIYPMADRIENEQCVEAFMEEFTLGSLDDAIKCIDLQKPIKINEY